MKVLVDDCAPRALKKHPAMETLRPRTATYLDDSAGAGLYYYRARYYGAIP
jgi:hypothetical protein